MQDKSPKPAVKVGFYLAFAATLFAFFVIILGAYTRLTDAGLGCPDWPGCYGQWLVPKASAVSAIIDTTKAWTEMFHRYMAGLLSLIIFTLLGLAIRNRHRSNPCIKLPLFLAMLVIFQGLLGMWTVTLKLFPLVVMAHLLGGVTTLSLLGWLTLTLAPLQKNFFAPKKLKWLKILSILALISLMLQIFLGGWTSANYAALVCVDFPFCQATQSLNYEFREAFSLTTVGVPGSIGTPLSHAARVTIHMTHRINAIFTIFLMGAFISALFYQSKNSFIRSIGYTTIGLLALQIILGIINVLALLPLYIALAHNAVAALLMLSMLVLIYYLNLSSEAPSHE